MHGNGMIKVAMTLMKILKVVPKANGIMDGGDH